MGEILAAKQRIPELARTSTTLSSIIDDRDIECAATQIKDDEHLFTVAFGKAIGKCGGRGFVD